MSEQGGTGQTGSSQAGPNPGGSGRRYQTSMAGMVGAMLVLLVAIGGFMLLRSVTSDEPEVEVEAVDYLSAVRDQQRIDRRVVYPRTLPEGWKATSIDYVPGRQPSWGIGMLTDEGTFVGVRQQDESVDVLLDQFVDEDTTTEESLVTPKAIAPEWVGYADEGGDTAFAAEIRNETILVFGSADAADLATLVNLLTFAPVDVTDPGAATWSPDVESPSPR
ncbi:MULTISPECIES: DUF4245 domain-containing protein [unclassified Nocardioides]|uniref:DUF4245 domain-containing protein n=1 Tax=unclassified Nocardioides TaxID=2615069 RepID=UPI00225DCEE3|nr:MULTISPECIES: DUF4245 domain-containing protein [unclassified Nocardioides]